MLFMDHSAKYTAQLLGWTEDYPRVCFVLPCFCHFIILIIERSLSWPIMVALECLFSMLKLKESYLKIVRWLPLPPSHYQVDIIWEKGTVRFFPLFQKQFLRDLALFSLKVWALMRALKLCQGSWLDSSSINWSMRICIWGTFYIFLNVYTSPLLCTFSLSPLTGFWYYCGCYAIEV